MGTAAKPSPFCFIRVPSAASSFQFPLEPYPARPELPAISL